MAFIYQYVIDRINSAPDINFLLVLESKWKVEKNNWYGKEDMLTEIFHYVYTVFERMFSKEYVDTKPIVFVNKACDEECPITVPECGIISLQNESNGTAMQAVYQAAHELCHMMLYDHNGTGGFKQLPYYFKWFEESICQYASWSVLDRLSIMDIPDKNLYSIYSQENKQFTYVEDTSKLYQSEIGNLMKDPCIRDINKQFAMGFEKNNLDKPASWQMLTKMHKLDFKRIISFDELLNELYVCSNSMEKEVVIKIASIFGIIISE